MFSGRKNVFGGKHGKWAIMAKKEQTVASIDEIFNLIRAGERQTGIELLYSLHYNKLYGIAFLFVKNQPDTEDIVHNAIYKLLNLELDLFPQAHVYAWLYTFMKNQAMMFLRKKKPVLPIDDLISIGKEDQKIENFVNMDAYYSMIKNLSEEQRQIVTLKVLGGYTHKEIAQMLGKPVGTVQWIYNTSIKKLKFVLSSLITSIFIFASVLVGKLTMYIYDLKHNTDQGGEAIKGAFFDFGIIIFAVLLVAAVSVFVIFLKKSEKMPTKLRAKSI